MTEVWSITITEFFLKNHCFINIKLDNFKLYLLREKEICDLFLFFSGILKTLLNGLLLQSGEVGTGSETALSERLKSSEAY